MRSPNDVGTTTLNELMDGDTAAAFEHMRASAADHPMAKQLFEAFRDGSQIMTKTEAYAIGNELNRQAARIRELEANDDGCESCGHDGDCCESVYPGSPGYGCTRRLGHPGDHVACSDGKHGLATWGPADLARAARDREVEEQIDDELARGAGK